MRLALEIEAHDKRYYQEDAPNVSDAEYDALRQRYKRSRRGFPNLVTTNSPSQKVGAAPSAAFKSAACGADAVARQRLREEDVIDFVDRIRRFLKLDAEHIPAIVAEPKIDGLSLSLRYEVANWSRAATRGDGVTARMSPPISARSRTFRRR